MGSSSISTRGRLESARAIITRWRWAEVSEATMARASIGRPRSAKIARVRASMRAAVDEDALAEAGAAGEDVLGDGELLEDLDLLRHVDDAGGGGVGGRGEADRLAGEDDLAGEGAGGMHAVQDLDQRRLAGAVLAEERVDLAGAHRDVDAAQRRHAAEALGDAADLRASGSVMASPRLRRSRGDRRPGGGWPTGRRCRGSCSRGRGRRR